jgi:hypothetical protein
MNRDVVVACFEVPSDHKETRFGVGKNVSELFVLERQVLQKDIQRSRVAD